MTNERTNETSAQLIDPVPEKVGRVEITETTCWNGWAYDDADGDEFDPIALFKSREHAVTFAEFLRSKHCPEDLRTNVDAAIMPAYVPQVIAANHTDDEESAEVMSALCGVGYDAWIGAAS
jgi:hypothetical protein